MNEERQPPRTDTPASASEPASVQPNPPARPRPAARAPADEPARPAPLNATHYVIFGIIVALALVLRLRDPLATDVMAAEDPYRHMERTWDLLQGKFEMGYPPGLFILMLPFAIMGPAAFYMAAKFLPPLFGVGMVVGVFLLARRYTHPAGALTAALLAACMPEAIFRTNVLFPTAIDMMLIPFFFLTLLRASELRTRKAYTAVGLFGVVFLVFHPWALALLIPSSLAFWVWNEFRTGSPRKWAWLAGSIGAVAGLFAISWNGMLGVSSSKVVAGFGRVVSGQVTELPVYVDLPYMLTVPALMLAAAGAVIAVVRRTPFSMLAFLWSLSLLPIVLVDWFDLWYIPHRAVAYLGIGVALLASVPIGEVFALMQASKPHAQSGATFGVVALALVVTVPSGWHVQDWYRIFDENSLATWDCIDRSDAKYVQAGSWQARAGYRALTGNPAEFNPAFFNNPTTRDFLLGERPGTVVLIDNYTAQSGVDTSWLAGWQKFCEYGTNAAYRSG